MYNNNKYSHYIREYIMTTNISHYIRKCISYYMRHCIIKIFVVIIQDDV